MSNRLRNFVLTSIMGMLVVLAGVIYFYGEMSTENLREHYIEHSKVLARVFVNSLGLHGLNEILTPAPGMSNEAMRNRPQMQEFSKLVKEHTAGLSVFKVKLYNPGGVTVYSTDPNEIGMVNVDSDNLFRALDGEFAGRFKQKQREKESGLVESVTILESYMPIKTRGDAVTGVFELYTDVAKSFERMELERNRMVMFVGMIFALYYAAQFFLFYRTERALNAEERERDNYMRQLQEANDLLEQRVIERTDALEAERFRLQSIIDGIADPLMVIGMDLRVTSMNQAANALIPKDKDPEQYRHCYEITHRRECPCTGEDHPCSFKTVMTSNAPCKLLHVHYNAAGERRYVEVTSTPMRDRSGEVLGIIEVEHDVTEVVAARNRVEESQERIQAVMDTVKSAILTLDEQAVIEDINESAVLMFGYGRQDLLGMPASRLLDAGFVGADGQLAGKFGSLVNQGVNETTAVGADGRRFPIELWVGEVKIQGKIRYIGVFQDISARKKAENALEETRQQYFHNEKMAAIGHLAAGILHEVGNPIAAISGSIQAIHAAHDEVSCFASACPVHDDNTNYLNMIEEQVNRLSTITREIADFASPRPRELELLDLNSLIRSTANLMRYDKRLKKIELQLDLDIDLPAVMGVADQLTQVFMNLIINAVDACGAQSREGYIRISSSLLPDVVHVVVQDNGCGMEPHTIEHAMDAFFTTKPAGKGTGLGLSLCNSIIAKLNGRMQIESKPGKGTSVHVYLPLDGGHA
jgi:PAS domain S-box-containing protein